jgi:hypothetical protein
MRTVTTKATAVVNYNHATIAKKLHALYNMRTVWFMQTGINWQVANYLQKLRGMLANLLLAKTI